MHHISVAERRSLIDDAIQESKYHAEVQNFESDGRKLLGRRSSTKTVIHGQARLLLEDIVQRAEMRILENARVARGASEKTRILGSLLTKRELARVYQEAQCPNFHPESKFFCLQQTNREHRTPDGRCNNLGNPLFGAAPSVFSRLLPSQYEDGVSQIRGTNQIWNASFPGPFSPPNPSAREISNEVVRDEPIDDQAFSHFLMQWGQWVDHDLDLALTLGGCPQSCDIDPKRCVPIPVAPDDPHFSEQCIAFPRSIAACGDSPDVEQLKPREQINELTSFIDGSTVYGSSETVLNALRERDSNGSFTAFFGTGENIPGGLSRVMYV